MIKTTELNEKKAEARKAFISARDAYCRDMSKENWLSFCEAKRLCRLLGVLI